MQINIDVNLIRGFSDEERAAFARLINVFNSHDAANREKEKYYEGKIPLREVNLGIALPEELRKLEIGCSWGAKAVDVLAGLSKFDGFVGSDGEDVPELDAILCENRLVAEYKKAVVEELKLGSVFATLSADSRAKCKIRFHSLLTAAALWSGEKGRIDCGFAIIDTAPDASIANSWSPSIINFYTDDAVIVLRRERTIWRLERHLHKMGRPLMEPLIWNATAQKPFGRSRIKEPIRRLIQGFIRTVANASIGLEFATSPQKYLLGVTDKQYDSLVNQKFRTYVGSVIAATSNPETGEVPNFGQLAQGSITPHVDMMRILSTQFSAATGLSVSDTGIVNDANPTSSEAITAQTKTLISMAEDLNIANGEALRTIAQMALAIANNVSFAELQEEQRDVIARFKNPAMPSVAVSADAALKIATARPGFSETDAFLEMQGFDQAYIRRIKAQEQRARGLSVLRELEE